MDFCPEYWTLVSSLQWADKIPGGLKGFNSKHLAEPSIIALKADLNSICNGLFRDFTEQEKNDWSSKMAGVFAWKWLLSCGDFDFLRPLSHSNMSRFKDLNFNLCYEVIKSNDWEDHLCGFLQSFNSGTYIELVNHFLDELLTSVEFPSHEDDIKFFVKFAYRILISFSGDESQTFLHPLAPKNQFLHHSDGVVFTQRINVITKLLGVMMIIFIDSKKCEQINFQLVFVLVLSFFNCISALSFDKIFYVSSINDVPSKSFIFDNDYISSNDIVTFDVRERCLGNENSHDNKSEGFDIVSVGLGSFFEFYNNCFVRHLGPPLSPFDKNLNFKGFSFCDIHCDMLLKLLRCLRGNTNFGDADCRWNEILKEISSDLEPLYDGVSEIMEEKRSKSSGEEFMLKVALMKMELQRKDGRELFLQTLLCNNINDEQLIIRQVRCLQVNIDLIDGVETFLRVHDLTVRIQRGNQLTSNEEIIKDLKKIMLKAYMKFDWSVRDEVVYRLNTDQSERVSIVEDVEDLNRRWKPILNRVTNLDHKIKNEMILIISLLLMADVKSLFDLVLREVVSNNTIIKVVAMLLGKFPKTLSLRLTDGTHIFYDSFASIRRDVVDPKLNLLKFVEFLLKGDGAINLNHGTKTPQREPPLSYDEFSLVCVLPSIQTTSNADLSLVELFLKVAGKKAMSSKGFQFVFFSTFVLFCELLEELKTGSLHRTNSNGSQSVTSVDNKNDDDGGLDCKIVEDIESTFQHKCFLYRVVDSWKDIYRRNFMGSSFSNNNILNNNIPNSNISNNNIPNNNIPTNNIMNLLKLELSSRSWWTQNHFIDCVLEKTEVILPQSLQHLKYNNNNNQLIDGKKCISDLIDLAVISDHLLEWSMEHLDINSLILSGGDDDGATGGGDNDYNTLICNVCQKLQFSTSTEWPRVCQLLRSLTFRPSKVNEARVEGQLVEASRMCHVICDALFLLKELEEKSAWNKLPWNRYMQNLSNLIMSSIHSTDLKEDEYYEMVKLCGQICVLVPTEFSLDLMVMVLERLSPKDSTNFK